MSLLGYGDQWHLTVGLLVVAAAFMRNASPEATGASMTKPLPRAAIVRGVPDTFSSCLTMEKPHAPIDVDLARKQHAQYVQILKGAFSR